MKNVEVRMMWAYQNFQVQPYRRTYFDLLFCFRSGYLNKISPTVDVTRDELASFFEMET